MIIDTRNIVSISEANQNFSKVSKLVDEKNSVIIMKNNKPKYIIFSLDENKEVSFAEDEKVREVSDMFIKKYHDAFVEMAK